MLSTSFYPFNKSQSIVANVEDFNVFLFCATEKMKRQQNVTQSFRQGDMNPIEYVKSSSIELIGPCGDYRGEIKKYNPITLLGLCEGCTRQRLQSHCPSQLKSSTPALTSNRILLAMFDLQGCQGWYKNVKSDPTIFFKHSKNPYPSTVIKKTAMYI